MIKFFRRIRQHLLVDNKFSKYLLYAVGEIVLIMIGIFMALQLQNWNENKRRENEFKSVLDQLYSTISYDIKFLEELHKNYTDKLELITIILETPDSIPSQRLPYPLHYLAQSPGHQYKSETIFHANNLKYNPSHREQNELIKEINNYIINISEIQKVDFNHIKSRLNQLNIPHPKIDHTKIMSGWIDSDSTYYDAEDVSNLYKEIRSKSFRTMLRNLYTDFAYIRGSFFTILSNGKSIMQLIKTYYPEVKILYMNVGIIGTSINGYDDVGAKSTPMIQTDVENSIWEIDLYLKEGTVKFRCRDSWAQNWGSNDFPKGIGYQDGPNIPVNEAGMYHVTLNLSSNYYEFTKKEE